MSNYIIVIHMTILNIHIKDNDKKKVQELVESRREKSMSDYIRKILAENVKIQEISEKWDKSEDIEISEYIPKNKYVGFVNGAVIAVSESPSEISQVAVEKFPNLPLLIKYNGDKKKKQMEYCFMSLSELQCWNYAQIDEFTYPILPITFRTGLEEKTLSSSIDTTSSLCVLKTDIFPSKTFEISREEKLSTAAGIIDTKIYSCEINILDTKFKSEFILVPIPKIFPFQFLIGRNLLDKLDAYFFGIKQIFSLKLSE